VETFNNNIIAAQGMHNHNMSHTYHAQWQCEQRQGTGGTKRNDL